MVETKRKKSEIAVDGAILGAETIAITNSAQTLAAAGFTVPARCTEIVLVNLDSAIDIRWHPNGTPTATFGHNISPGDLDNVPHNYLATCSVIADSGTPDLSVIYLG